MNIANDLPPILEVIAASGGVFSLVFAFVSKKIWEGVGILKDISLQMTHLDSKLSEVHTRVIEVESSQRESTRDSERIHVRIDDHERRLNKLENK